MKTYQYTDRLLQETNLNLNIMYSPNYWNEPYLCINYKHTTKNKVVVTAITREK